LATSLVNERINYFQGVAGLFTKPVSGAKKDGAAGFIKGLGLGLGMFAYYFDVDTVLLLVL
jgi:hypothetical protein